MPKASSHAATAAPAHAALRIALSATALLSILLLLLVPRLAHATPVAESDLVGRWVSDRNAPSDAYVVSPGPAGTLVIAMPAKAFGRAKGETATLQRVGPNEFATAKGARIRVRLIAGAPGHAEVKLVQNDPSAFIVGDELLVRP